MKTLHAAEPNFQGALTAILDGRNDTTSQKDVSDVVQSILADIKTRGDGALLEYTAKFDKFQVTSADALEVSKAERLRALESISEQLRNDLTQAAERVKWFHARQTQDSWSIETEDNIILGHRIVPMDAVGVYVPGGTAAYPSSVLMNIIPARVAGVEKVVAVTPAPGGVVPLAVLAAAEIAGVDQVFKVGGAQAIGALAYGTKTIPRVDKIVGPGNQWVATAKQQVFGAVDIDMIAGPTELCVVATRDGGATPEMLAADLLSQAEHDMKAMVTLITPDEQFATAVINALKAQLQSLPRAEIAVPAIRDFGLTIITESLDDTFDIVNTLAPEHLQLVIPGAAQASERIRHAGAIFLGPHTPEAIGDYIAGPNHVLPTNGTARFFSPLGVYDFVKRINVVQFSEQGLAQLGPVAVRLAQEERLDGHAMSVKKRLEYSDG